ncbi:MAG: SPOR domain-containing protein [Proteobacteria bacterium]|nr:SPOR domain-containing protein [Pseudomonadota bacterium]
MNTKLKLAIGLSVIGLSSCGTTRVDNFYTRSPNYVSYQPYVYDNVDYYQQNYDTGVGSSADYTDIRVYGERRVSNAEVPESYYTGSYRSPVSPKEADKSWAKSQNVGHYTIQVADEPQAASVAATLSTLPKTDRSAEIKYQANGKTSYRGVYGSYKNYQEAEQALSKLPADVKNRAIIKIWSNVQN